MPLNSLNSWVLNSGDPLHANVILAMSMDGNAGDVPTDALGHVITALPGASLSTTNKMFGTASANFDGTIGNGYTMPNGAAGFDLAAGVDFTIECWIYLRAYGSNIAGGALFSTLRGSRSGYALHVGTSIDSFRITSNASGPWADNLTVQAGGGPALNVWTHMCLERFGDTLTIYKNGQVVATRTGAAALAFLSNVGGEIGTFADQGSSYSLNGQIDDMRFTKGVARYKGAFTPPNQANVYP